MKPLPCGDDSRFFISALGLAQICSWGTLFYGFPLIAEAMRTDLGWSKPMLYGAATSGMLLAALAAYPVGSAIDRGYGRVLMAGSSAIAGVLLVFWSQVETPAGYFLILAMLGCMQAATLYEPAFAVVARRYGARRARSGITTLTLWGGFASTVFIPVIQYSIGIQGWRGTLVMMAGVNILVCGSLYFLAIDPKRDNGAGAKEIPPSRTVRHSVAAAMRRPSYWGLMVAWISYAAAFSALTYHLFPLLLERGLDATETVIVLTVIGPAQVLGRIVVRALAAEAPVRMLGSAVVLAFPLAVAGLAYAPPELLIISGLATFYGAANGIVTIVRGAAVPEMVTGEAYGAVNGTLVAPMHLMQAIAPMAAALLWQNSGSYDAVLVAIFLGSVTLCAGFWFAAYASGAKPLADPGRGIGNDQR